MAIQLGLVAELRAMWIAHLLQFRGNSFAEWIGMVIVVQIKIVGSLFKFASVRFCAGWVYVVGVGVAGGIVKKAGPKKRNFGLTYNRLSPTVSWAIFKADQVGSLRKTTISSSNIGK